MRAFSSSGVKKPLALGSVLAVTGATAAFAFVGTPGTGGPPVTDRPDLLSATTNADNAYGDRAGVTYCFDEQLQGPGPATNYIVKTYDGERSSRGVSSAIVPTDGRCVSVQFNPRVDLNTQGSAASVNGGTVTNLATRPNYASGAPLTGSTLTQEAGKTTGPDLRSVIADQTTTSVRYTFDQPIDPAPASIVVANFTVVADNGAETAANALVNVDPATNRSIRVSFPAGTNVSGAIRYSAARGAVRTLAQDNFADGGGKPFQPTTLFTVNPDGVVGTAASSRPVLVSAAPRVDGSSQFVLTYTSDLGTFTPASVVAVFDNAEQEAASAAQNIQGQTRQRLISFPTDGKVDREPGAVVAMVSKTGAATTANGNLPAPISGVNVGPGAPSVPGFTNGPDLLTTNIDATASQATFLFDEPVNPDNIGGAANFLLLVPNGDPIGGTAIAGQTADRKGVLVSYSGDVTAAVGVALNSAQVFDRLNNPNSFGSVSTTNIPLPPTGTTGPPGVTPTPTATVRPNPTATPPSGGRRTPGLSATVRPKRDRRKPFRFTTTGTVRRPSGVPASACNGRVKVQVKLAKGGKTVSSRRVTVRSNCKFTSRVTFRNKKRFGRGSKKLKFVVQFQGNAQLRQKRVNRSARIG